MSFWCAALLYMPPLIAGISSRQADLELSGRRSIPRFVFTSVATPLALLAIVFGTSLFLIKGITDVWLILKLTLVSALGVCHALNGWLILRVENLEQAPPRYIMGACLSLGLLSAALIAMIVWLVLAKPAF